MPSFCLTRDDLAELQRRIVANTKAQLRREAGPQARAARRSRSWWLQMSVWVAVAVAFFFLFRWAETWPDPGSLLAAGAVGSVVGALALWALIASGTRALQGAMFEDDGWCLAPQTINVRDDCIEQRSDAAQSYWQWTGFKGRQESSTLVFLFVDITVCLVVPKSILTPDTAALIEQRVPLRTP